MKLKVYCLSLVYDIKSIAVILLIKHFVKVVRLSVKAFYKKAPQKNGGAFL